MVGLGCSTGGDPGRSVCPGCGDAGGSGCWETGKLDTTIEREAGRFGCSDSEGAGIFVGCGSDAGGGGGDWAGGLDPGALVGLFSGRAGKLVGSPTGLLILGPGVAEGTKIGA